MEYILLIILYFVSLVFILTAGGIYLTLNRRFLQETLRRRSRLINRRFSAVHEELAGYERAMIAAAAQVDALRLEIQTISALPRQQIANPGISSNPFARMESRAIREAAGGGAAMVNGLEVVADGKR